MKKTIVIVFAAVYILFLGSCASSQPSVTRINSKTQTDLSGYWNDTDVRIVCESLIDNCLKSARVAQAIMEMRGRAPVVLVGGFRNESSEQIDTGIISTTMEIAIFNTGRMNFVAGGKIREELRAERIDQQNYASESTAASLANEIGANFMLFGTVRTIVDKAGNQQVKIYYVSAEMTNVSTGERLWIAQNSDIKKLIIQPKHKL